MNEGRHIREEDEEKHQRLHTSYTRKANTKHHHHTQRPTYDAWMREADTQRETADRQPSSQSSQTQCAQHKHNESASLNGQLFLERFRFMTLSDSLWSLVSGLSGVLICPVEYGMWIVVRPARRVSAKMFTTNAFPNSVLSALTEIPNDCYANASNSSIVWMNVIHTKQRMSIFLVYVVMQGMRGKMLPIN